jgi:hypothetical protein
MMGGSMMVGVPVPFVNGSHPVVAAVRDAVQHYTVTRPDRARYPVAVLRSQVVAAWHSWHTSPTRRTDVGSVLPALLGDCHDTASALDGAGRREAHAVLADVYCLAQHVLVNAAEPELMWLVAERSMNAARAADEPVALAGAAWTVGMVLRAAGRMDESLALVDEAAALLEPSLPEAPHDRRGLWGALQLHAASTLARAGREGDAWARWDRAEDTARRLPPGYAHSWSMFSVGNVALHGISVTVDLWKSRDALRRAESLDPSTIPSRERRGRLFVEMARGHHAAGERIAATRLLSRACDEGVDAVRWSPAARVIVTDLRAKPPAMVRQDVADLVARIGVPG